MARNSSESYPTVNDSENETEDLQRSKLDVEAGEVQPAPNAYGPTDGGWDAWGTVFGATMVSMGTFG